MTRHVLVVEDHPAIQNLVALHLADMDCRVTLASDGNGGMACIRENFFDLIVLDWMLPGVSGIEICREARRRESRTPIIMLTANNSESDRVTGLDAGADDYVAKPFSVAEFLARVRALFRRTEGTQQPTAAPAGADCIRVGDLVVDTVQRQVRQNGASVDLTAKEFDLLCYLARRPGWVFTRQQLLDAVWGDAFDGYEHTVNSHINRLRAKIEKDAGNPDHIVTVWGVGYKMAERLAH